MQELTSIERQQIIASLDDEDPLRRVRAQMILAEDAVARADLSAALAMATKGLQLAHSIDDLVIVPDVLMTRAAIHWDLQRFEDALLDYADAAAMFRSNGEVDCEGLAYLRMAWVAFESGNAGSVYAHMERAVAVYRDPADERILGNLIRMAEEALAVDEPELSCQCSGLVADIATGFGDEPMRWDARCLTMLARHRLGDYAEATATAQTLLDEALAADSRDRAFGVAVLLIGMHHDHGAHGFAAVVGARIRGQFGARLTPEHEDLLNGLLG